MKVATYRSLRLAGIVLCLGAPALTASCDVDDDPLDAAPEARFNASSAPAPAPLAGVTFAGKQLTLWPYTGTNFSGQTVDPINLLFTGKADVRSLRAGLMSLDGNRTAFGFPAGPPFDCRWKDAIGGVQAGYSEAADWSGSSIQLECGEYTTLRFHIRFFGAGDWTIANAHLDVLIPGTTDHEVLSWELGETLVMVDMLRTGLLDPASPLGASGPITAAPSYRTINPLIYNGLPSGLITLIGGPPAPVASPVPIGNNGIATIFNVAGDAPIVAGAVRNEYDVPFNQVIPKPFCASGPQDFVHVSGTVRFEQDVNVTSSGNYHSDFRARGSLIVTPFNPFGNPPGPLGPSYQGEVSEVYQSLVTSQEDLASMTRSQRLFDPTVGPLGDLKLDLRVGPSDYFDLDIKCAS